MIAEAEVLILSTMAFSSVLHLHLHSVTAKKEGIRRIRVDNEESFYQFLNVFLREITPSEKDIREEYRKEYKRDWYLNDIMINEKLELYKNGELLIKLDEQKIEDECGKMELLL